MATSTTPLTVRSDETAECCPALLAEPLDPTDAVELAAVFKALADPVRLQLLSLIAAAPNATACSCDLEEPVGKSQPTVSHHLSVLADAGKRIYRGGTRAAPLSTSSRTTHGGHLRKVGRCGYFRRVSTSAGNRTTVI